MSNRSRIYHDQNGASEMAKRYKEVDQIYDFIRGLGPLPLELRTIKSIDFEVKRPTEASPNREPDKRDKPRRRVDYRDNAWTLRRALQLNRVTCANVGPQIRRVQTVTIHRSMEQDARLTIENCDKLRAVEQVEKLPRAQSTSNIHQNRVQSKFNCRPLQSSILKPASQQFSNFSLCNPNAHTSAITTVSKRITSNQSEPSSSESSQTKSSKQVANNNKSRHISTSTSASSRANDEFQESPSERDYDTTSSSSSGRCETATSRDDAKLMRSRSSSSSRPSSRHTSELSYIKNHRRYSGSMSAQTDPVDSDAQSEHIYEQICNPENLTRPTGDDAALVSIDAYRHGKSANSRQRKSSDDNLVSSSSFINCYYGLEGARLENTSSRQRYKRAQPEASDTLTIESISSCNGKHKPTRITTTKSDRSPGVRGLCALSRGSGDKRQIVKLASVADTCRLMDEYASRNCNEPQQAKYSRRTNAIKTKSLATERLVEHPVFEVARFVAGNKSYQLQRSNENECIGCKDKSQNSSKLRISVTSLGRRLENWLSLGGTRERDNRSRTDQRSDSNCSNCSSSMYNEATNQST